MKCLYLGIDGELAGRISESRIFSETESVNILAEFNDYELKNFEVVIVSDRLASPSLLSELRKNTAQNCHIFFIMSDTADGSHYNQVQMQCLSYGISLVPANLSIDQITSYIVESVFPEKMKHSSNVITFFGSHPGVGVTTILLAIARRIASISKVKVGVLGLNVLNPGDCNIPGYEGLYLDELKSYLSNSVFSEDQLHNSMYSVGKVKYLAGNRDIKKRLHYTIEEINFLIELAKNVFDIVLIDAGSQFDNALAIQSLLSSDLRFLIAAQGLRGYNSWKLNYEQIIEPLGYTNNSFLIICNRFKENINFPKVKYLQDLYNITFLQTIPDIGDLGFYAEQEQRLLADFGVKQYDLAISKIVNNICKLYGITTDSPEIANRTGIIHRLFSMF